MKWKLHRHRPVFLTCGLDGPAGQASVAGREYDCPLAAAQVQRREEGAGRPRRRTAPGPANPRRTPTPEREQVSMPNGARTSKRCHQRNRKSPVPEAAYPRPGSRDSEYRDASSPRVVVLRQLRGVQLSGRRIWRVSEEDLAAFLERLYRETQERIAAGNAEVPTDG